MTCPSIGRPSIGPRLPPWAVCETLACAGFGRWYHSGVKRVREIAEAIGKLSPEEHRHFIEWFEQEHFRHAASARVEEAQVENDRPSSEGCKGDEPAGERGSKPVS